MHSRVTGLVSGLTERERAGFGFALLAVLVFNILFLVNNVETYLASRLHPSSKTYTSSIEFFPSFCFIIGGQYEVQDFNFTCFSKPAATLTPTVSPGTCGRA